MDRFKKHTILLFLLMACMVLSAQIADEFIQKIQTAKSEKEALGIINEYVVKTSDLDDLRIIQNPWIGIDPKSCNEYFSELFRKNPKSEKYHYLWVRTLSDNMMMLSEGKKLVKSHPKFRWGYRLVTSTYNQGLFVGSDSGTYNKESLINDLPKDRAIILEAFKRFPEDEFNRFVLINLHIYEKSYKDAEKLLLGAKEASLEFIDMNLIVSFTRQSKSFGVFEKLVPMIFNQWISAGRMSRDDYDRAYTFYYLDLLKQLEDWDKVDEYFRKNPAELDNRDRYPLLISLNIARKNNERAMDYIATLLREDVINIRHIESNSEWQSIAGGEKWLRLIYEARLKWDNEADKRRAEILSSAIRKPAFDWELPDKDGKMVKLSDFRGQVVILDFWATWCNPCRLAMPVIDKWMRDKMPAGVQVFSINIWERDPQKAKDFMAEKAYAMTLLMGYNELAQEYGFDGIPYICAIDKDGYIRFFENGFSQDLSDKLSAWVEMIQGPQ